MRLANCIFERAHRVAIETQGKVALLPDDVPDTVTLATNPGLLKQFEPYALVPVSDVEFLPPVLRPGKILCVGVNFRSHAAEAGLKNADPPFPSLFCRFPESQVGHNGNIIAPSISEQFDFEGELALIIGTPAWRVDSAQAAQHIVGYSCFAENSVRDFQKHAAQVTAGKNFLSSGAFGPWLTTADEVGEVSSLELSTKLNGIEMQRASLNDMIFSVDTLVSYISQFTRLLPGDVIAMGTPAGVGALRDPKVWLKPGDHLQIDISRVGRLEANVRSEQSEEGSNGG